MEKTYYAPQGQYGFYVVVKGEDGKPAKQYLPNGAPMFLNSKPVTIRRHVKFNQVLSSNPRVGLWVAHRTSDPDEIEVLDGCVADRFDPVMDEDQYKNHCNPERYAEELRRKSVERELEEERSRIEAMKEEIEKSRSVKEDAQKRGPGRPRKNDTEQ